MAEARVRVRGLADAGLAWIEEPTRADDYAGTAEIRNVSSTPIQLGENYWGPNDMAAAIAAGAGDYMMPDAMRIGGVTGWMRAAALRSRAASHYAMGYSGSGTVMAPYLGAKAALQAVGSPEGETGYSQTKLQPRWFHPGGRPHFLQAAEVWYKNWVDHAENRAARK